MSELEAAQQNEFSYVTIAELVAHAAEQHLEEDIGGNFNKVEGAARALTEGAATALAAKHIIAQASFALQRRDTGRLAVGAIHRNYAGNG